nr:exodeoxyribonuclease V subunit beta [Paraglaciecola marina]
MSTQVNQSQELHMQPLDPISFPLYGPSLIEASAGTGKTYTIVNLYLRLLLGRGCQALGVEQILVVTFTNAATGELKERIRQRLRDAHLAFFAKKSDDPFIQQLIEQSDNIELDCQRLSLASKQMDEAAVYTIHGFCHKALTEHAFESGAMYEQSFILDESEWLKMAAEDYWRKHVTRLDPYTLEILLKQWTTPQSMLANISGLLAQHAKPNQTMSIETAISCAQEYAEQVAKVKHWWLTENITEQLSKANLSGRSKLAKLPFLQAMQAFCNSDILLIDFDKDGWNLFFPEKVEKAKKKGSADLSHLDFSRFEALQSALTRCQNTIKIAFSEHAMSVVSANLASHKQRLHLLSPEDLLAGLQRALRLQSETPVQDGTSRSTQGLASTIVSNFPAALIDEFQDTDPIQFEVFQRIYGTPSDDSQISAEQAPCWIMIGDPKQAIYGFRGADIFTYIKAKQWVPSDKHFTLATNWRSAPDLINAINQVFSRSAKGFLFEENIPFQPVGAGRNLAGLRVQGDAVPCLDFLHLRSEKSPVTLASEAYDKLALATAKQISHWLLLAETGQAQLNGKTVTAADCCVLVRNRNEAQIIKSALASVNVASVFLSRTSVFSTQVALDLLRLLKALSQPTDERLLKTALLSELFTLNDKALDALFNDEARWQEVLELSAYWHQTWKKHGIIKAINQVLDYFNVEQGLIQYFSDGLRRVTDLRHLSELLQQQSIQLIGEAQLIHWYENCLLEPDHQSDSQQMRLESDANLVQIITLHSSKGLEYPLVFIPFASSYKNTKEALYHNEDQDLEVDFLTQDKNLQKADFERLAEDIRLFYVAVTRAIYYCSVGVWNVSLGKSKKESGFALSALGSLLMFIKDDAEAAELPAITDDAIADKIDALTQICDVSYRSFTQVEIEPSNTVATSKNQTRTSQTLQVLHLPKPVQRTWRLTSYSAISSQQVHLDMPSPGQDEGLDPTQEHILIEDGIDDSSLAEIIQTPFNFERGANAGSFLHGVLENIDLQQPEQLADVIKQQATWFGIDESWQGCLETWLEDVLKSPFSTDTDPLETSNLSLAQLAPRQVKVEMEFHMPLHQVKVQDFNRIINQYSKQHVRDYQFEELNGMIKGFIDLMFEFNGKFYVADYKSNHLGDSYDDYHLGAMEKAMTEHDYHLQAILYTLALHRWLDYKLPNYEYSTHIGGAYYLFLRGMSQSVPGNGVYFVLPEQSLIEQLDDLFSDKLTAITPQQATRLQKEETLESPNQQGQLDLW